MHVLVEFPNTTLQISSQEYPWIIDAWRKLDPRIKGEDILMRMEPAGRPAKWNTFQQRLVRLRPDFNILSWHQTRNDDANNLPRAHILANLTHAQREMNTTRGTTPGLVVPEYGEDGGRIPLPDHEDSRGFGREFRMRQGQNTAATVNNNNTTANTITDTAPTSTTTNMANDSVNDPASDPNTAAAPSASQKRRRRPTKKRSKPMVNRHTEIKEEGETTEESSEDKDEDSPPRKVVRKSGDATTSTSASIPASASRTPNNNRRQTIEHVQQVNTRRSTGRTSAPNPTPLSRTSNNNHHQTPEQAQHVNTQRRTGCTEPQQQPSASDSVDPRIAPYAARPTTRDPYFMDRLMGRRSTLSTGVINRSGLRFTDSPAGYRPFSAMDARRERRPPPEFYTALEAADAEIAGRSHADLGRARNSLTQTGSQSGYGNNGQLGSRDIGGDRDQNYAQARTAQASMSQVQSQGRGQTSSAGRLSNVQIQPGLQPRRTHHADDTQGAPNTGSDFARQTRFVQRPQNVAYPGLLTRYPQAGPLGADPMAQTLRRNPNAMRAHDRAAWRDMNLAHNIPPALDISRRMAEQYAQFLEDQAIRVRIEQGIPTPPSAYSFIQGLPPHFPPHNRVFAAGTAIAPPPKVFAQQSNSVQEPPQPPTPAVTPNPISPPTDAPEVVSQQDDSAQEVVHLVTISKEQKASAKPRRAKSV